MNRCNYCLVVGLFVSGCLVMLYSSIERMPNTSSTLSLANESEAVIVKAASSPSSTELGIYMWEAPGQYLSNIEQLHADFILLSSEGVNAVYIRIDDYIDYMELPDPAVSRQSIDALSEDIQRFVNVASQHGFVTYALAGGENWEEPGHDYIPREILKYAIELNEKILVDNKLKGIHFDIEPYSKQAFNETGNQQQILERFVYMTDDLVSMIEVSESDLYLGITVPYWLDNVTRDLPVVTFHGAEKPALYHIIDSLNRINTGQLIVMSYRNFAYGQNGSIELSQEEINYANSGSVAVILAQETLNYNDNSRSSFFGFSREDFFREVMLLNDHYAEQTSYGGIALHHFDSVMDILN